MQTYDLVIIGSGIYGLYISNLEVFKDKKVLILECDKSSFSRASYINQARVHNGYHYPRSLSTAKDTHNYFEKFNEEFRYAINDEFTSIYAIAKNDSLTSDKEFELFCEKANIPIEKIDENEYFKPNKISSAYLTKEYVFDANLIRQKLLEKANTNDVTILYSTYIKAVFKNDGKYILELNTKKIIETPLVINTTYSSINIVNKLFGVELLDLKYELCEVELGIPSKELSNVAFTIMDGDFFSTMPFGKENYHTLTSVHFTPHLTSYEKIPKFSCQEKHIKCGQKMLFNCNNCKYRPNSKEKEMYALFNEYLLDKYKFEYKESLFAIKPILMKSENDDSRPTIIKKHSNSPTFISCLSGKVSTIYLMEEFVDNILKEEKNEN